MVLFTNGWWRLGRRSVTVLIDLKPFGLVARTIGPRFCFLEAKIDPALGFMRKLEWEDQDDEVLSGVRGFTVSGGSVGCR